METIYLSLRAQVAVGTFFMKSPVADWVLKGLKVFTIVVKFVPQRYSEGVLEDLSPLLVLALMLHNSLAHNAFGAFGTSLLVDGKDKGL